MCGILGIFGLQSGDDVPVLRRAAYLERSSLQLDIGARIGAVFTAVRAPYSSTSDWPLSTRPAVRSRVRSADGRLILCVNGEIYNHQALKNEEQPLYTT